MLLHLKAMPHPPKVFVFTTSDNREMLKEASLAQPQGFVHKADRLATIREALRLVAGGGRCYTPYIMDLLGQSSGNAPDARKDLS